MRFGKCRFAIEILKEKCKGKLLIVYPDNKIKTLLPNNPRITGLEIAFPVVSCETPGNLAKASDKFSGDFSLISLKVYASILREVLFVVSLLLCLTFR